MTVATVKVSSTPYLAVFSRILLQISLILFRISAETDSAIAVISLPGPDGKRESVLTSFKPATRTVSVGRGFAM